MMSDNSDDRAGYTYLDHGGGQADQQKWSKLGVQNKQMSRATTFDTVVNQQSNGCQ